MGSLALTRLGLLATCINLFERLVAISCYLFRRVSRFSMLRESMTVGMRSLLGARAVAILEPFNPTFPQTRPTIEKAFDTASRADVERMFGLYSCGRFLPMFLDLQQRP